MRRAICRSVRDISEVRLTALSDSGDEEMLPELHASLGI